MQRVLRKRVMRDLKQNLLRYVALMLLILCGMYMVVSMVGAADTIITGVNDKAKTNHVEDGEFTTLAPLSEKQEQQLTSRKIVFENNSYLDYEAGKNRTLRVFKNRRNINQIDLVSGRLAKDKGEAVIENQYSQKHDLSLGDTITVGKQTLHIVGIGTVPDYDSVIAEITDTCIDSDRFGLLFVANAQYEQLKTSGSALKSEQYVYSYRLNDGMTHKKVKKLLQRDLKLTSFMQLKAADNPRIKASADDQAINKSSGLLSGVIVIALFAYVISVFIIHQINAESSVIGALYAMGVTKRDLIIHYLTLPVLVTLVASIIGTILGFSPLGLDVQMADCVDYYSVPVFHTTYPLYLIVYGILMPPIITILVNWLVINRKLSSPVLHLMRKEQSTSKLCNVKLRHLSFLNAFRIRQSLRELRTSCTVILAMFISLLILMMGLHCYTACHHTSTENKADTKYQYMYSFKMAQNTVPAGGTPAYVKSLKKKAYGYNLDVSLLGIEKDNPYFQANVKKGEKNVVISSSVAQKFRLTKGDSLVLRDDENEKNYTFTIDDVTDYSVGLYVFMDLNSMRSLFDQQDQTFNVVFSGKKLNVEQTQLSNITTKHDISKSADIFLDKMNALIVMLITLSIVIFCFVMYLMIKIMIDRSTFSISLIKIFGYRMSEIRKLYLNGNFYMIAIGAAVCIPLAKLTMDQIYPYLVANVAGGMDVTYSPLLYVTVYVGILAFYLLVNVFLEKRLKNIVPAEVLKNRE